MSGVLMMMIGVSVFLAFVAFSALAWGIKGRQFDDDRWIRLDDSEESLKDAIELELRKKEALLKKKNK